MLIVALGIYAIIRPEYFRCLNVDSQKMKQIAPRIYVTPQMPTVLQDCLLTCLTTAQKRVEQFFGTQQAKPVIIAGHNIETIRYFGAPNARTGLTHLAITGAYIVLEPEGINSDVLAHELCHAELLERIGWCSRTFQLPAWFDEGLAMLVDYRFPHAEEEWHILTHNGTYAPDLQSLSTNREFFSNPHHTYLNYLTARHEVKQWYQERGQAGLLAFCRCMAAGNSFKYCYCQK